MVEKLADGVGPDIPQPFEDLHLAVAQYLAEQGVIQDPLGEQVEAEPGGPLPVFFYGPPAEPDGMVQITARSELSRNLGNARVLVTIAVRTGEWDELALHAAHKKIFQALHGKTHTRLNADTTMLLCERTDRGGMYQDTSRRWYRIDMYDVTVAVPTIISEE